MTQIMTLIPYRYFGGWVFDDAATGLTREAFVAGADTMLDVLAVKPDGTAADKVRLNFSADPFPGAHELVHVQESHSGNTYLQPQMNHLVWLCPALLKYFSSPPKRIYFMGTPC